MYFWYHPKAYGLVLIIDIACRALVFRTSFVLRFLKQVLVKVSVGNVYVFMKVSLIYHVHPFQ